MVLDAGNIVRLLFLIILKLWVNLHRSQVEFDSPRELLKLSEGKLRSLVDESGDKDLLYAMANGEHE